VTPDPGMDKRSSVLIVEDDRSMLNVLTEGLSINGYHCETAPNAEEALNLLGKTSFDIVITDIALSGMTGLELTAALKQLSPATIVITMTGYIDDFNYDKAIEAGASDFIKKPFTLKELLARIKHAKRQEETRGLLLTDDLTGLLNRRGLFALAEQQLKIAKRNKKGLYILYADLDGLKEINDVHGHIEGDQALVEIANILRKNYREADISARVGGDEFVVLSAENFHDNSAVLASRLQNDLETLNSTRNRGYVLSISCGSAYFDPQSPCSLDELLQEADKSMYEHKLFRRMNNITQS
jgi:two-component system cell cycle response regulator